MRYLWQDITEPEGNGETQKSPSRRFKGTIQMHCMRQRLSRSNKTEGKFIFLCCIGKYLKLSYFHQIDRSIHTFMPVSPMHMNALSVARRSVSVHQCMPIGRKCTQSKWPRWLLWHLKVSMSS